MYDYIIIGQGLAGTILSYQLIKSGNKVLVINQHDPQSSSHVAAGIFSPIAGQRIAKILHADEALPFAHTFYPELEKVLNVRFFHPMPYVKLLINEKLKTQAEARLQDSAYEPLLTSREYNNLPALEIAHAGYVDIPTLLDTYRAYLCSLDAYKNELFDERQLDEQQLIVNDTIVYKNIKAKRLIFCNGLQAGNNRFFNQLAFNPTKGELLTIRMSKKLDHILSGNLFILPIGNNLFYVGATFERDYSTTRPTQQAKQWLIKELNKLVECPYEIVSHKAGIRPTTLGHRPFVVWHKIHSNVGVFSGFGSKGVSLIPYMAQELAQESPA